MRKPKKYHLTITSEAELVKKLHKNVLLTVNGNRDWYLSDNHKTKCGPSVVGKLFKKEMLEKTVGAGAWFETEFRLKNEFRTQK